MPDTPKTSLATTDSLTLPTSRTFRTRLRSVVRDSTSFLRNLIRSRKVRIEGGGMKLRAIRPCRTRFASHSLSFTSVFRPGTFLMWYALPTITSKASSRIACTDFQ